MTRHWNRNPTISVWQSTAHLVHVERISGWRLFVLLVWLLLLVEGIMLLLVVLEGNMLLLMLLEGIMM